MGNEWQEMLLGDVINLQRGFDLPQRERKPGKFPVITSSGVNGTHSEAKVSKPGVVTGRYGTIGEVFYITEDFWPHNTTLFVKDFKNNHPLFISFLLRTINFQSCSDKSSVPGVNRNDLHRIKVKIPPLPEQKAIAHILGTLDDKIELNQQMNQILEAMARAIFKSWFVDFDPVRAKMEGKQPVGMDEATAALFPDSFEESDLGLIPKGWRVEELSKVTSYLQRGIQPKYLDKEGVLVLNQRCIRDYRIDISNARRHDTSKRSINGRKLEIGDVLINSTGVGTLGRVAQVLALEELTIVDSHVTIIRADYNYLTWNTLGLSIYNRQLEIEGLGEGSTGQTELSKTRLGLLELVIPPLSVQKSFDEQVLSLREKTILNDHQSRTLATIRDTLLPKLMSGEIRVKEAERIIEEVA